jgi:hypothetical protein
MEKRIDGFLEISITLRNKVSSAVRLYEGELGTFNTQLSSVTRIGGERQQGNPMSVGNGSRISYKHMD